MFDRLTVTATLTECLQSFPLFFASLVFLDFIEGTCQDRTKEAAL